MSPRFSLLALPCLLAACDPVADPGEGCEDGVAILGCDGDIELVIEVWGDAGDGLDVPRDLGFNPSVPGELWVVNRADDSTTIYFDAGTGEQTDTHIIDPAANHFMEEVSSIAFGAPGTFGTCQESNNTYDGQAVANNFMGPTLWPSDLDVYGETNPAAVESNAELFGIPLFMADLGSHLDMLHESPWCMGIAWSHDNVYWVFDGAHSSINRYDFQVDHGPGYDDHSDGIIGRYVEGEVQRLPNVPSHMELDRVSGLLYVADTGNNRVAVLDTDTGERGGNLPIFEPGTDHYRVDDADLRTLVDGADAGFDEPSGLALHDGVLYVGDHRTGAILAFDLEGNLLDTLDLARPGLMGIDFDEQGRLWTVDANEDELVRVRLP